ncbi:hypothetical protein PR048_029336 [Dryococelus australis]|uniref:Uncharacterized protein n=1 Tax=Dryococelus australis TaxID=614101 RepID=A0ABQ9GD31_9NEOP|nr:hypothetical protein PR048_029336 [Dryococelus australis]
MPPGNTAEKWSQFNSELPLLPYRFLLRDWLSYSGIFMPHNTNGSCHTFSSVQPTVGTLWGFIFSSSTSSCGRVVRPCHHLVIYQCLENLTDCSLFGELVSSPTDVAYRMSEIQELTRPSWWKNVPSDPAWLRESPAQWPSCSETLVTDPVLLEQKVKVLGTAVSADYSLTKLLTVMSLVLCFIHNCHTSCVNHLTGHFTPSELKVTSQSIVACAVCGIQRACFCAKGGGLSRAHSNKSQQDSQFISAQGLSLHIHLFDCGTKFVRAHNYLMALQQLDIILSPEKSCLCIHNPCERCDPSTHLLPLTLKASERSGPNPLKPTWYMSLGNKS